MNPTVGRIVHFYSKKDAKPLAMIIVAVDEGKVVGQVFTTTGGRFSVELPWTPQAENDKGYSWDWPPRG